MEFTARLKQDRLYCAMFYTCANLLPSRPDLFCYREKIQKKIMNKNSKNPDFWAINPFCWFWGNWKICSYQFFPILGGYYCTKFRENLRSGFKNWLAKCKTELYSDKYELRRPFRLLGKSKKTKRWHCTKNGRFPLRIFSVNVTKSAVNCRFGHIYWRNP